MSVSLLFDQDGLTILTEAMLCSEDDTANNVEVSFDKSILTLKKKSPIVETIILIRRGKATSLSLDGENIAWALTDEDRECLVTRFKQCKSDGTFTPAELIRVQVPKNKKLDYVYGKLAQDMMG